VPDSLRAEPAYKYDAAEVGAEVEAVCHSNGGCSLVVPCLSSDSHYVFFYLDNDAKTVSPKEDAEISEGASS